VSGLVYRSLGEVGEALVVIDAARRLYVGLSRDGSYHHVVHPTPIDMVNADNAVVRSAGQLVCTCKGSAFRGTCYRTAEAESFEAGRLAPIHGPDCDADLRRNGCVCTDALAWLDGNDSPAGAGEAVEAFRG
jgi:hypothetical protein